MMSNIGNGDMAQIYANGNDLWKELDVYIAIFKYFA